MDQDERIPILAIGDVLVISIQTELHDGLALHLQNELTTRVADTAARGVLIEVSAVDVIDSFLARVLHDLAAACATLGAPTVLVGIRPAVAITLVELGLALRGLGTARSIETGLAQLNGHR